MSLAHVFNLIPAWLWTAILGPLALYLVQAVHKRRQNRAATDLAEAQAKEADVGVTLGNLNILARMQQIVTEQATDLLELNSRVITFTRNQAVNERRIEALEEILRQRDDAIDVLMRKLGVISPLAQQAIPERTEQNGVIREVGEKGDC